MSIGSLARAVLGDRFFPVIGRYYRAFFVDLTKVAEAFPTLPPGTSVLDIGGGDGELINLIFDRQPQVRFTMIDLKDSLGGSIRAELRPRVEILPATSIRALAALNRPAPSAILVSDVLHHVPVDARPQFMADLRDLLEGRPATLIVKDVAPGSLRASLGYLADRYISGDHNVTLIGVDELRRLVLEAFPGSTCETTNLIERDAPNYCVVFTIPARKLAPH